MSNAQHLADRSLYDLLSLEGRVAVITGGASGIGQAIAARLHEAGARVIIGDIDLAKARRAALALDSSDRTAAARQLDVLDGASIAALAKEAVRVFGSLDIWVNNAGGRPEQSILDMSDDQFDAVIDLNLRSAFIGSREAARHMVKAGRGVILNTSSVTAFAVRQSPAHYVAAKHGLTGLTKTLAAELGPQGIRVVALAPTVTNAARAVHSGEGELADYAAQLPLQRIGHPDDTARAAVFAASDLAAYITGTIIMIDGGDLAR